MIRQLLRSLLIKILYNNDSTAARPAINGLVSYYEEDYQDEYSIGSIRIDLTSAIGGRILKIKHVNRSEQAEPQLYIIAQGEDVGARISKIINLELLR